MMSLSVSLSVRTSSSVAVTSRKTVTSPNGPEFISRALDQRAYMNKVILDGSRLGREPINGIPKAAQI
jgi:hypothetical protein